MEGFPSEEQEVTRSRLANIFLIVFIDMLGFGLILPLLPFYAEMYGATPFVVGLLVAVYAAAQLIGGPVLGRLSDRYGRRPILLVSLAGTFVGFLLLALAEPLGKAIANGVLVRVLPMEVTALQNAAIIAVLFASRFLDGLTGGNITVAQAYITDVTDEKNRAKGLGMVGAAFGLGFILGPAAGGFLSQWGFAVPALAAAGLALFNMISVFLWLPESLTPERRAQLMGQARPSFSFRSLWAALTRPRVGPLLHIRFFFGLASATFQTIFALWGQARLGLDAQATGYVLAYVGVLVVLVQGVFMGRITARFGETQLILWGSVLMAVSLAAWAVVPNLALLLIVLIPLSLATGVLNTVLSSALTKAVYPEEVGGTLGLATSAESLSRVIAPVVAGVLLGSVGAWAPGFVAALIMVWVVAFVLWRLVRRPDPPLSVRSDRIAEAQS
jgi:DHA1 family tetracycline resistance protein-like MFS transporter